MPRYSEKSKEKLATCDPRLQRIFNYVIQHFDNTILCGVRSKEAQDAAFEMGHSKVQWPNGKHNVTTIGQLSRAVDAAPYPIDWKDRERMTYFAGFVKGVAAQMNIRLRWGGDWDRDFEFIDQTFDDLVHWELI